MDKDLFGRLVGFMSLVVLCLTAIVIVWILS